MDLSTSTATVACATVTNSGDDTNFTVTVTATAAGDVTATIPAGGVEDLIGNVNNASTSTDNVVTYAVPTENCSNGIDDDLDGLVDNFDNDCSGSCTAFSPTTTTFAMTEKYSLLSDVRTNAYV